MALIPCYSILVFINRSIHNSSLVHTTLLSNAFFLLLNVIEKQDNWEHISKTWGSGNLISHFVNSIVSPVCLSLSPSLFCCYLLVPQVSVFVLCVSIKNLKNLNSNAFYQLLLLLIFFSFFFSFSCYVLSIPQFASFEKAKEIEEFFASRTNSKIARTLKQSIERVHINANWVQRVHNEEHLGETVIKLLVRDGEIKCVIL